MGVLLGLASAITYGAADFFGGYSAKRTGVFSVIVVSQVIGNCLLLAVLPFFLEGSPDARMLLFGGGAGIAGALGVGLFYKGLSVGRMSVIAPVTAVLSACIPVVFGIATGDRPSAVALVGVGLALAAAALISWSPGEAGTRGTPTGFHLALVAGVGFGLFFILLARAGTDGGLWPLVSGRAASLMVMVLGALVTGRTMKPSPGTLGGIAAAGLLDVGANIFYLSSTRHGLLSLVAVLTSLYPASTVLLARVVLKERLFGIQVAGLAIAAAGVVLISAG